jgi:hypothetical protein
MILSMRTAFFILPTLAAVSIGSLFYPGQFIYFLLFSVTFFAVLYSAFFLPFQYSHLFLAIPWFLGFWLKLVVHFVLAYFGLMEAARYVEPAGKFDCAAGEWDQVLIIASVGGLGYILGRLLLAPLIMKSDERPTSIKLPPWYRALRMPLWALVAIAFVAVIYANAETGLIVRGYVPRIQLPWPFGALFAWTTDIGFALVLSVLAVWDRRIGAGPVRGFFALCIEGAIISIQTNSRGIYLFHTLPALVSEARRPIAVRSAVGKAGLFLGIWFAGAIAIPLLTTGLRAFGENVVLARTAQDEATTPVPPAPAAVPPAATRGEATATSMTICSAEPKAFVLPINPTRFEILKSFVIYAVQGASRLIIDRWPGMEGLMATQSYPERGLDLLKTAAFQRRTYGMVDIYTQTIAGSDFTQEKAKKYHNATLAGPIAFLYYSGSRLVVFVGMALLAILVSILELIWARLVPDPLVIAMSGCYLALVVMQLSTGIRQAASGPLSVTILLALVWVISRVGVNTAKLLPDHA